MKLLSIVIPVYNECGTWREVFDRVVAVPVDRLEKEIILVDDGSTDGTREELRALAAQQQAPAEGAPGRPTVKVVFHERNRGKGAALQTGFAVATGDIVLVQDADLEYAPSEYPALVQPILDGRADVVYGSRFAGKPRRRGLLANYLANRSLTWLSNLTTGLQLTDMETCYKVVKRGVLERLSIEENRFGFEPEITAKIAALRARVVETPISYNPRTQATGKKIGWKDGFRAIWCILKYGLLRRGGRPGPAASTGRPS